MASGFTNYSGFQISQLIEMIIYILYKISYLNKIILINKISYIKYKISYILHHISRLTNKISNIINKVSYMIHMVTNLGYIRYKKLEKTYLAILDI